MKKKMAFGAMVLLASFCLSANVFGALRPTASEFPQRTLIIGEYAIVLEALTDELYELAQASALATGQDKIYFKSDMNTNTWYDITNSTDITEISKVTANIVTNQVIDDIELRYYTKKTGETIDLMEGKEIQVSSLSDKTDPSHMEELAELVQELEIQKASHAEDSVKSLERVLRKISVVVEEKEEGEETEEEKDKDDEEQRKEINQINKQLQLLEQTSITMMQSGEEDAAAQLNIQKENLENRKDFLCYDIIYTRLEEENKTLDYEENSALMQKYATAMTNIKTSQTELGITEEEEDSTGIPAATKAANQQKTETKVKRADEAMEDALEESLQEALLGGDTKAVAEIAREMAVLQDVKDDTAAKGEEAAEKQVELLKKMKVEAEAAVKQTVSAAQAEERYQNSVEDGTSDAAIEKVQGDSAKEIASAIKRLMETDDKLNNRITDKTQQIQNLEKTGQLMKSILANASIHMQGALSQELNALLEENDTKLNEVKLSAIPSYQAVQKSIEVLDEQSKKTYESYMAAVENNDMAAVPALQAQLDKLTQNEERAKTAAEAIEEAVKNGDVSVDVVTGKMEGKEADALLQEASDAVMEGGQVIQEAEMVQQQAEESTKQESAVPMSTEQESVGTKQTSVQVVDQRYTEQETAALQAKVQSLGQNYAVPWILRFTDYDVKLMSPVYLSGKEIYVPVRELSAQIGITVIKSEKNNAVVLRKSGGIIEYIPKDTVVYVNDKKTLVKPAPNIFYDGQEYLPLSCFEKAFGFTEVTIDGVTIVSSK